MRTGQHVLGGYRAPHAVSSQPVVVAAGAAFAAATGAAAKWPMDKTMTIVVPWPAGTGADLVARVIADGLMKKWGNQVVVENSVGATGNIGQNFVAKAAPDGYTYIVSTPGPAANNMPDLQVAALQSAHRFQLRHGHQRGPDADRRGSEARPRRTRRNSSPSPRTMPARCSSAIRATAPTPT